MEVGGGRWAGVLSVFGIFHSLGPRAAKKLSKIWTAKIPR